MCMHAYVCVHACICLCAYMHMFVCMHAYVPAFPKQKVKPSYIADFLNTKFKSSLINSEMNNVTETL